MAIGTRFPFDVDAEGGIGLVRNEDAGLRGKIIQVLCTAPGERVNQPGFGCGLLNLVLDPNNEITAAAAEFTIGQALTRWLGDEIIVGGVDVSPLDDAVTVEVAYLRRRNLFPQRIRLRFG
ncbi:GPW/gp25 family protein [Nocardia gipuzkoensis]|uniref:GPW/gp25 family protein n=1 Tax=Nocardia gipuzkoensis TaxID=2749991 RepID=UPI003EE3F23E